MICTFFGHKDSSPAISKKLENAIENLISKHGVTHFYIGNHGIFDRIALQSVTSLKEKFPFITYEIVLAYLPKQPLNHPTLYPEGIEKSPKRFAICFRNQWMIHHSDYVLCHVLHSFGGAYQFAELAKKQGKTVINIT